MKSMTQIENQAFRLGNMNWLRKNTWSTSEETKAAKMKRDELINKAYYNAAAKHLTAKAKNICKHLRVWVLSDYSDVVLDYDGPGVGFTLKIAGPFEIEMLLNDNKKVVEIIKS